MDSDDCIWMKLLVASLAFRSPWIPSHLNACHCPKQLSESGQICGFHLASNGSPCGQLLKLDVRNYPRSRAISCPFGIVRLPSIKLEVGLDVSSHSSSLFLIIWFLSTMDCFYGFQPINMFHPTRGFYSSTSSAQWYRSSSVRWWTVFTYER